MQKALFVGLFAGSLTFAGGEAASAPIVQTAAPTTLATGGTQKDAPVHPFSAVLRYGPGTTSICRSLSDNSSAICLLLALHMIQLSQKPVSDTSL